MNIVPDTGARSLEVGLFTGGIDKPYAFGLATALLAEGVSLDFIGSDDLESPGLRGHERLTFLNLRESQAKDAAVVAKIQRIARYYLRLIRYAASAKPRLFHVLWNNRFQTFDRTLLTLYYRLLRKKIVLTVHNVNAARRDGHDSWVNRLTLRCQYRLAHHLMVHTVAMKQELVDDFGVRAAAVTVIPLGLNNSVPDTALTSAQARDSLGLGAADRVILFFGRIGPYKGLDLLVAAFEQLAVASRDYRLLIVGEPKDGCEPYWRGIERAIAAIPCREQVIQRIEFVPDSDTERYFKAADVLALPYTDVFQSGVLVLGYTFGLPVVGTDVGSLREDIIEGRTGFLCRPRDPADLATAIETYFTSDLFANLAARRQDIRRHAASRYSWQAVGSTTRSIYAGLLAGASAAGVASRSVE
jgi:glycosyltransferase involved in cell wall biosynthesis